MDDASLATVSETPTTTPAEEPTTSTPASTEGEASTGLADASGGESEPAEGEPKAESTEEEVSLRLANRKLAKVAEREKALAAKEAKFADFEAKLASFEQEKKAHADELKVAAAVQKMAKEKDVLGYLEAAGFEPADVAEALRDPDAHKIRRQQKEREAEDAKLRAEIYQQKANENFLADFDDAREALPELAEFVRTKGERTLLREAIALATKWQKAGKPVSHEALLRALNEGAKKLKKKPDEAQVPGAKDAKKPGAVTARSAAAPGGGKSLDDLDDDERRALAIRRVEEAMRQDQGRK